MIQASDDSLYVKGYFKITLSPAISCIADIMVTRDKRGIVLQYTSRYCNNILIL